MTAAILVRDAASQITALEPFTTRGANNLHADVLPGAFFELATGALPEAEYRKLQVIAAHSPYVVWSYSTPIAWVIPAGTVTQEEATELMKADYMPSDAAGHLVYMPAARYSLTTSEHQNATAIALGVWQSWRGKIAKRVTVGRSPFGPRAGW